MTINDSGSVKLYNNGMITREELINTPYRDSCVIPSITPQEIPQFRMGWICPKCGCSNSPDIFFCTKCQNNQHYPHYPNYPNPNPWENGVTVTYRSLEIDNPIIIPQS